MEIGVALLLLLLLHGIAIVHANVLVVGRRWGLLLVLRLWDWGGISGARGRRERGQWVLLMLSEERAPMRLIIMLLLLLLWVGHIS